MQPHTIAWFASSVAPALYEEALLKHTIAANLAYVYLDIFRMKYCLVVLGNNDNDRREIG
jgi:hypothetical protein